MTATPSPLPQAPAARRRAIADYGMTPPTSMLVLGIDDHGVLELRLHFSRT